jgi:DNA-binding transcriptional MerR regulator
MAKSASKGGPKAKRGQAAQPATKPSATVARRSPADAIERDHAPPEVPEGGKLYHRIGEVSRMTGVKAYVLRYWESEFRWMSPHKSRSKQRLYRPKDIEIILLIKTLLYEERYTIAGARQKVRELVAAGAVQGWLRERSGQQPSGSSERSGAALPTTDAARSPRNELRKVRAELQAIRNTLGA